ncbi:MAG: hypothetical protein ACR2PK_20100 [Acidimicrobiales bacterium]
MDTSKPGPLLMLVGGALMIIGSFLDWGPGTSGLSTDVLGLLGILTLLIGLVLAIKGGINAFAPETDLPDELGGLSTDKISVFLSASIFLWTFGLISADFVEIGVHLTWIGAAVATVGGVMTLRDADTAPTTSI